MSEDGVSFDGVGLVFDEIADPLAEMLDVAKIAISFLEYGDHNLEDNDLVGDAEFGLGLEQQPLKLLGRIELRLVIGGQISLHNGMYVGGVVGCVLDALVQFALVH